MFEPRFVEGSVKTGDNEVRYTHSKCSGDEEGSASKSVNVQNGRDGSEEEKDAAHTRRQEGCRVASKTQVLEDELEIVRLSLLGEVLT